ncbi:MAG: nucleoside triphosphate pyrophosphohydrolase [Bacteroidota bacterium]|jgi:XTP/dITP diphosphohydrolase
MYSTSFDRLANIMDQLREQCPWDAKQTITSLRPLTIEETYELADAIDRHDWQDLKKELGDLLLHIFFYVRIAREQKQFTMADVLEGICNKLVHRHPHIYSNVQVDNEDDVKKNWEQLKLKEGNTSLLAGVPSGLPAMVKALRVQEKVKQVGFEWDTTEQVKAKLDEELNELDQELSATEVNAARVEEEFGDVLFSMVNYARWLKIDPEQALEKTTKKFMARFQLMEKEILAQQKDIAAMSLEEMDAIWNDIKKR